MNETLSNTTTGPTLNSHAPLTPLQIATTIVFAVFSCSSLLAYILVMITLIRYFNEFKSSFYYFVISLGIADMAFLSEVLFYCVPCTILQRDLWSSVPPLAGLIEEISFFVVCNHLAFIAINRVAYAAASGPKNPTLDKIFSSKPAVVIWLTFLWTAATALPAAVQVAGCELLYDVENMGFIYACTHRISAKFTGDVLLGETIVSNSMVSLVTACHLLAWFIIYWKGRKGGGSSEIVQQRKREIRLLIQFTLISLLLVAYCVTFWVVPYWFRGNAGMAIITVSGIAAAAVNPFTYLMFNKLIKAKAKHLVFDVWLKMSNAVQQTPVANISSVGNPLSTLNHNGH